MGGGGSLGERLGPTSAKKCPYPAMKLDVGGKREAADWLHRHAHSSAPVSTATAPSATNAPTVTPCQNESRT